MTLPKKFISKKYRKECKSCHTPINPRFIYCYSCFQQYKKITGVYQRQGSETPLKITNSQGDAY